MSSVHFPPVSSKKESESYVWTIPLVGVGAGAIAGIAAKAWEGAFFTHQDKSICKQSFSNIPVLQAINNAKQWEVKRASPLTPLALLGIQCVTDAIRAPSDRPFIERLKTEVKKLCTADNAIYGVAIALLGLTSQKYAPLIGLQKDDFDASGHFMLKTLWSIFTARNLYLRQTQSASESRSQIQSLQEKLTQPSQGEHLRHRLTYQATPLAQVLSPSADLSASKTPTVSSNNLWVTAATTVAAVTDALFLSNTAYCWHTGPESLVGIAWGASIAGIAEIAIRLRRSFTN